MRRYSSVLCVLLLLLPLQACSAMFANGPPSDHETLRYFDCNSNAAAPATDGFFGGTYALGFLIGATSSSFNDEGRSSFLAVTGALSAAFLGSMIYGIIECTDCSSAKEQLRKRLSDSDAETSRTILELQRQLAAQGAAPAGTAVPILELAPPVQETPAPTLPLTPAAPANGAVPPAQP